MGKRRNRKKKKCTSDTILYADDLGARESASTMIELEEKTGIAIVKLYKIMRESRLAVNNDKTQIMFLQVKEREQQCQQREKQKK